MICYRKNKDWAFVHVDIGIKDLDNSDSLIEKGVLNHFKLKSPELSLEDKIVDIIDIQIISSTYNPKRETTLIDMLVCAALISDPYP